MGNVLCCNTENETDYTSIDVVSPVIEQSHVVSTPAKTDAPLKKVSPSSVTGVGSLSFEQLVEAAHKNFKSFGSVLDDELRGIAPSVELLTSRTSTEEVEANNKMIAVMQYVIKSMKATFPQHYGAVSAQWNAAATEIDIVTTLMVPVGSARPAGLCSTSAAAAIQAWCFTRDEILAYEGVDSVGFEPVSREDPLLVFHHHHANAERIAVALFGSDRPRLEPYAGPGGQQLLNMSDSHPDHTLSFLVVSFLLSACYESLGSRPEIVRSTSSTLVMRVTMAQRRIVLSILKLLNDDVMIRSAINGIDPTISMGIVHESLEFEDVDAAGTNLRLVRLTSANSTGNLFK